MLQVAHVRDVLRDHPNGVVVALELLQAREHADLARNLVKAVLGDVYTPGGMSRVHTCKGHSQIPIGRAVLTLHVTLNRTPVHICVECTTV